MTLVVDNSTKLWRKNWKTVHFSGKCQNA